MAPFAKVGGLADVTAALSRSLAAQGHDVRVVLPLYGQLNRETEKINRLKKLPSLSARVGQQMYDFSIYMRGSASASVKVYLVESVGLFDRPGIYCDEKEKVFPDALQRSCLHNQAALMLPGLLDWPVDIIHCHDASSAPAILFKRYWYGKNTKTGAAGTVYTIHNLAHQEIHSTDGVNTLGLPASMSVYPGILEFHRQLNLMKAGILAADHVNTVSPGYAKEITTDESFGCGLDGVLQSRKGDFSGILNGCDYKDWNPAKDKFLPASFGPSKLDGKAVCRKKLLSELGLKARKGLPVCGFVGRLVQQKGIGLILPILERLIADGFTFVFLGTGDTKLMEKLKKIATFFEMTRFCNPVFADMILVSVTFNRIIRKIVTHPPGFNVNNLPLGMTYFQFS